MGWAEAGRSMEQFVPMAQWTCVDLQQVTGWHLGCLMVGMAVSFSSHASRGGVCPVLLLSLVREQALTADVHIHEGQTLDGLLRRVQDGAWNAPQWVTAERRTLERMLQTAILCGIPGSLELTHPMNLQPHTEFANPLAVSILTSLAEDLGISIGREREKCPDTFVRGLRRGYVSARRSSFLCVLGLIPQKERRSIGLAFRRGLGR